MFLTREAYATLFGATQKDSSRSKIATIFHDSNFMANGCINRQAEKSGENVKFAE